MDVGDIKLRIDDPIAVDVDDIALRMENPIAVDVDDIELRIGVLKAVDVDDIGLRIDGRIAVVGASVSKTAKVKSGMFNTGGHEKNGTEQDGPSEGHVTT